MEGLQNSLKMALLKFTEADRQKQRAVDLTGLNDVIYHLESLGDEQGNARSSLPFNSSSTDKDGKDRQMERFLEDTLSQLTAADDMPITIKEEPVSPGSPSDKMFLNAVDTSMEEESSPPHNDPDPSTAPRTEDMRDELLDVLPPGGLRDFENLQLISDPMDDDGAFLEYNKENLELVRNTTRKLQIAVKSFSVRLDEEIMMMEEERTGGIHLVRSREISVGG